MSVKLSPTTDINTAIMIFDYIAKDNKSILDSVNVSHYCTINILLVAD